MSSIIRTLTVAVLIGVLAACGGSDVPAGAGPVAGPVVPPVAAVVARVEITPAGGMLFDTTERRALAVRAFDANGAEVPVAAADVTLTSSDAAGIEVGRAGTGFEVRAAFLPRSAVLTASVGAVSSKPAVFYSARPAPGAMTVSDGQVRSALTAVDPTASRGLGFQYRVTLSEVGIPSVGTIVVGTGVQPVGGRVIAAASNALVSTLTDVTLELVPLGSLFDTLDMDLEFSPAQMKQLFEPATGVTTSGRQDREKAKGRLADLGCEVDVGVAGITAELELNVEPRISSAFHYNVAAGVVRKVYASVSGHLDTNGKAVIGLGAALTGNISCKRLIGAIPIPITGALAPLIAPIVPLNVKFDLGALVQFDLFTFSAEVRQTTEVAVGFDFDIGRAPEDQFRPIKLLTASDPEFTRSITFPTDASLRVKATAFLGLSSGLALGGALARIEVIEVFGGAEFESKFGGSYDVAIDNVYTSEYGVKLKGGVGPGDQLGEALRRIFGSSKAINLTLAMEKPLAKSPSAASVTTEKSRFTAGEAVRFAVELAPESVSFPFIGYNVKEVRIYRLRHGGSAGAEQVAAVLAFDGQTSFELNWTADVAGTVHDEIEGKPNFYAFVVDKPLAPVSGFFPFELGAVRARDVGQQGLIAGGGTHSLAIDGSGRVASWGSDWGGALGRDNLSSLPNYVDGLPPGVKTKAVAAGAWNSLALMENGSVYAWGYGPDVGPATGYGFAPEVPTAKPVYLDHGVVATAIALRYRQSLVLTSSGAVYSFGRSNLSPDGFPVLVAIDQVKAIAAGEVHGLALRNDGTVWAWGRDTEGQTGGAGTTTVPARVPGLPPIKAIAASSAGSFALDEAGHVWSWGSAVMLGRAGSGAPARIDSLSGVKAISAGNYSAFALIGDGTVMAWGQNLYDRVGVASADGLPARIPGLTDVVEVIGAEFHGMALTSSGAVYAWGRNENLALNGASDPPHSAVPILSGFFR